MHNDRLLWNLQRDRYSLHKLARGHDSSSQIVMLALYEWQLANQPLCEWLIVFSVDGVQERRSGGSPQHGIPAQI